MELKGLKSGTDVRGTAVEGYGSEVNLGKAEVRAIADAFGGVASSASQG